jgi:redox-sensitive bicupin YhaK (pirin superfamily)
MLVSMTATLSPDATSHVARKIVHRTRGQTHGPITRLMSPGDLGELVKPFIFLDRFEVDVAGGRGFPAHPHSGLATHTTLLEGASSYGDATGKSGRMEAGGLGWMQAGGGVWHWGSPEPGKRILGYQLWVALPAALEHAPAESAYIDAADVPKAGNVRVLLGRHGALASPIAHAEPLTYLHVQLRDGESWTYAPDAGHDVAWLAVHRGRLHVSGAVLREEMAVFAEATGDDARITLRAEGDVELVLGSAAKHPHPLVCGDYSVHTSEASLARGEAEIARIGRLPHVLEARRR